MRQIQGHMQKGFKNYYNDENFELPIIYHLSCIFFRM